MVYKILVRIFTVTATTTGSYVKAKKKAKLPRLGDTLFRSNQIHQWTHSPLWKKRSDQGWTGWTIYCGPAFW